MALKPGTQVVPYQISAPLGAGGMGEVYRATDTRLKREVAIKVLPEDVAGDSERLARFEREAHVLASLNHPHIASIYGLEESDGMPCLVLELVEGQTLAERLAAGALPVDKTLEIARQIAAALEAAHEKGVIHRDLKPANVKVTPEGLVKVLDFGLAKAFAVESAEVSSDPSHSPTLTAATRAGAILGTAAYMGPEQARGKPVDKRTDIWAFGCVLFEMLSGRQAFPGKTVSDSLARILEREPDWERLPKSLPREVRRLLRRCLTKDIRNRLQAVGDARITIQDCLADSAQPAAETGVRIPAWRRAAPWALLPLAALAAWVFKPTEPTATPIPTLRLEIPLPEGERLASYYRQGVALSPDGRHLAFVSGEVGHVLWQPRSRIYLRRMDQPEVRAVPGSDNGLQPFFSPDGNWLGFTTLEGVNDTGSAFRVALMKAPVDGGESVMLCESGNPSGFSDWFATRTGIDCDPLWGATWTPDDAIIFAGSSGGLRRVSAEGGEPETLTRLDGTSGEVQHTLPRILPGGDTVLFMVVDDNVRTPPRILAQSLSTGERKLLKEGAWDARFLPTGHLVIARDGRLFAIRFDPDNVEFEGPEVPVLDGVSQSRPESVGLGTGVAQFSVADTGLLVYAAGSVAPTWVRSPVWVDRRGLQKSVEVEAKGYDCARVSEDGNDVLLSDGNTWLLNLERMTLRRQTIEGGDWPIWGPETDQFTYAAGAGLYSKSVDSSGGDSTKELWRGSNPLAGSWSPDGNSLAFWKHAEGGSGDIWIASRDGNSRPFLDTRFNEMYPEFSPDGGWLLYTSDDSGHDEVYVRPYPGPGPPVQISSGGGQAPAWSRDGTEIFYRDADRDLSAVRFDLGGDRPTLGKPIKLFNTWSYILNAPVRSYDVHPDGRFLMLTEPDGGDQNNRVKEALFPTRLQLVQNWFAELQDKLPTE
jgi:serine/threonine-protein kinase